MTEKRRETRSLCADLVALEWTDESGVLHETQGVLEDISAGGACLQVEIPVPVDARASLRHGRSWAVGCRVAYCVYREIGYFTGVQFSSGMKWSEQAFRPGHLLDLDELARSLEAREEVMKAGAAPSADPCANPVDGTRE